MIIFISILLVIAITLPILKDIMMTLGLLKKFIPHQTYFKENEIPFVSVLLPVRNEAENIRTCLNCLVNQTYPKNKVEVLVGNDDSTDNTAQLVQEFVEQYDFIKLINIEKNKSGLKGKSNVLAQLARMASGDYFLMTDGDMDLPNTWAYALVGEALEEKTGVVTGTTLVKNSPMQSAIYMDGMGLFKVTSDTDTFTPGLGNNMVVSRQAYLDIGGYENMPFSIVEDYALSSTIARQGYKTKHVLNDATVATTLAMPSIKAIMQQRKRWLKGAQEAPKITFALVILPYITLTFLVVLFMIQPWFAIGMFALQACVKTFWLNLVKSKLTTLPKETVSKRHLFLYNLYFPIVSTLIFYYFILPTTIKWKNRPYS